MPLSSKIKAMFSMAMTLSLIGAVALAQNLEVKGNAWFATGGSGSAGIGTAAPLGKLHVIAPGGFLSENADGTSQATNVPILAQGGSTVLGMLNAAGRQVGAINVDGDGGTTSSRGYLSFSDKTDGIWRASLFLKGGNAGIGTLPSYRLDVAGDVHASGWLRTDGSAGWYSQTYGGGWYMSDPSWIRTYGSRNVWTDSGLLGSQGGLTVGYGGAGPPWAGAIINGSVGIGTTSPAQKLDVRGGIAAGNSDLYFTNPNHYYTGFGNTAGYAAIEDAANYGTLMILGRAGTSVGRKVDVWDYLQVNGSIRATGGTGIYTVNAACGGNGVLTIDSTCTVCTYGTGCGPNFTDCCGYSTYNNSIVGRLVDP